MEETGVASTPYCYSEASGSMVRYFTLVSEVDRSEIYLFKVS
jgi:hypothetical protein